MDLSIIIPVYNVSKYIEKCILSVLNNNLEQGYEIIVIDDASPDNSVEIVKGMMEIYPQIQLFQQENKGLGGARNTGIDNAKGQYVLFLDADDYLKEDALVSVLDCANKNALDILEFGAIGVTEAGAEVYKSSSATSDVVCGFQYLDKITYMNSACNKLYSVSFLNNYKLRFKERIFIEDFEFNTRVFYCADRVKAVEDILGCFVQTSNSITRNKNTEKNFKMISDIFDVIELTIKFKKEISNISSKTNNVLNERIAFLTLTLLFNLIKLSIDKKQCKLIIENLKLKKLYPIRKSIRDRNKNLLRLVSNNEFLFFQLIKFNKLIKR